MRKRHCRHNRDGLDLKAIGNADEFGNHIFTFSRSKFSQAHHDLRPNSLKRGGAID